MGVVSMIGPLTRPLLDLKIDGKHFKHLCKLERVSLRIFTRDVCLCYSQAGASHELTFGKRFRMTFTLKVNIYLPTYVICISYREPSTTLF